jgi:hypothetical protein
LFKLKQVDGSGNFFITICVAGFGSRMEIIMKRKRLLATLLALLFSFSCLSSASAEVLVYNDNTFVNLLNENNVTINGAATNMTAFEISGFLKTFSNDR